MTPAERESYGRQFENARRHIPRRHVINHCIWRDGLLTVQHGPASRPPAEPVFEPRVRRGVQQGELLI